MLRLLAGRLLALWSRLLIFERHWLMVSLMANTRSREWLDAHRRSLERG